MSTKQWGNNKGIGIVEKMRSKHMEIDKCQKRLLELKGEMADYGLRPNKLTEDAGTVEKAMLFDEIVAVTKRL